MKAVNRSFGKMIRRQREDVGFSQEELAYRAGLHRTYVSLIERGQRTATITTIMKLAKALGTTGADLVREAEQEAAEGTNEGQQ